MFDVDEFHSGGYSAGSETSAPWCIFMNVRNKCLNLPKYSLCLGENWNFAIDNNSTKITFYSTNSSLDY